MGSADRIVALLALLGGAVGLASGILELCRAALELHRERRGAGTGHGAASPPPAARGWRRRSGRRGRRG